MHIKNKKINIRFPLSCTRQTSNLLQDLLTVNTSTLVIFFLMNGFAKSKLLFIYLN